MRKKYFDIKTHPKFKDLVSKVENSTDWNIIKISGIPTEFIQDLIEELPQKSFIYTTYLTKPLEEFITESILLKKNEIKYSQLISLLTRIGYTRNERVGEQKEFSVKGDTITLWPSFYDFPIKVDFFGDDIESIEQFDLTLNKSLYKLDSFIVGKENLLEETEYPLNISTPDKELSTSILFFDQYALDANISFDFRQPQLFFSRLDLLENFIKHRIELGFEIIISTRHKEAIPQNIKKYIVEDTDFPSGIISESLKKLILTDREIFGTIFLSAEVSRVSSSETRKLLAQFEGEVEIGDYIVHEDHGVGIYNGVIQEFKSEDDPHPSNYIQIKYAENDELLVPLNMINKITKYIGVEGDMPQLTRLGRSDWNTLTTKVKKSIEIMASELVQHYAKISLAKTEVINQGESSAYREFEERFEHEETPDQLRSIEEINRDLTLDRPMNRLLVGDVGFGKTEVIMRAAFKTIEAGKQVAVLCPTTVLAYQHYRVFTERFKDFGVNISLLSRFSTKYQNQDSIKDAKEGKTEIIIGTHRLLSNDLDFKNLGLLVIDEEQKFGVKQKEKLRHLKYGVHVLTTTATPIPRTLSMALSSIQDISVIQTPPKGRKPVTTYVEKTDWNKIVDAVRFELSRGGQVYIIHNSVKTIASIGAKLISLMPEVRLGIGHGQMAPNKLEQVILNFIQKEYNVLLCTTIIENGIDLKDVNTIIVLKSQNFGLSQLYQLRGRVGRSPTQAYAYFFYDGDNLDESEAKTEQEEQVKIKRNKDYIKRLKAISEATQLGAGFEIATKDLEIRGAGNILGRDQHGNMSKIGYGLYMQLLAQEIERLKNDQQYAPREE